MNWVVNLGLNSPLWAFSRIRANKRSGYLMPITIDLVFPERVEHHLFLRYVREMLNARGIKTIAETTIVETDGAVNGRLLVTNQIDQSRVIQILIGTNIMAM